MDNRDESSRSATTASSAKSVRHTQKTRQIAHFLMVGSMAGKFIKQPTALYTQ
jgi:hypothetical protein